MNLSDIKKLVSEEKKIVVVDGDDALVVMAFDEYKKLKGEAKEKTGALSKPLPLHFQPVAPSQEKTAIPANASQPDEFSQEVKPDHDLTLDDLPF